MLFQSVELVLGVLAGVAGYALFRWAAPGSAGLRNAGLLVFNVLVLLTVVKEHTLIVLGVLAGVAYGVGLLLRRKRRGLVGALAVLVALFAARNYPALHGMLGPMEGPVLSVEKLGLSYILFRWVHWLVENARGTIRRSDVLSFLNYTFFFPTVLAGPIDTYRNFEYGVVHRPRAVEWHGAMAGVWRVGLGAFKTVVLVPVVRPWAVDWEAVPGMGPTGAMAVSLVAYSAYILLDFSGYTDIAVGVGRWLGVRVPENFDRPYGSRSLAEFWRRWHMTFSGFLRAYVFLPLVRGLNRWEALRRRRLLVTSVAYLLTFVVCGLWHGDRLHFVVWGAWHGAGLIAGRIWRDRWRPSGWQGPVYEAASVAATWGFVTVGWGWFHYPLSEWAAWAEAVMR